MIKIFLLKYLFKKKNYLIFANVNRTDIYSNKFLASWWIYFHHICIGYMHLVSKIIIHMHNLFNYITYSLLCYRGCFIVIIVTPVTVNAVTRFDRDFNYGIIKKTSHTSLFGLLCASVIYKQKIHNLVEHVYPMHISVSFKILQNISHGRKKHFTKLSWHI